jgi:hypothetical protein
VIDERTDLPEGTEVELQLVKVADAFAEYHGRQTHAGKKGVLEGAGRAEAGDGCSLDSGLQSGTVGRSVRRRIEHHKPMKERGATRDRQVATAFHPAFGRIKRRANARQPGDDDIFCRAKGASPVELACLQVNSLRDLQVLAIAYRTFEVQNRLIYDEQHAAVGRHEL